MNRTVLIVSTLLLLAACGVTTPLQNVDRATVVTGSSSSPDLADVRKAIIKGANSKGWTTEDIDTTHMLVTLNVRKHMAQVVIEYSPSYFSINYKDSHTLKYGNGMIHKNYNKWIRNLKLRITEQLAGI